MKKVVTVLAMCMMIGFLLSCNKNEAYIGKWHAQLRNGENNLTLYENGDYTWNKEQAIKSFHKGKWEVKGDTLYMSDYEIGVNDMLIKYYVVRINEHQLFIKTPGADWAAQIYEFERKN